MTNQDPPTLEERVEMLEKRMRVIKWTHEIDWNAIAWDAVILIAIILIFVLVLVKDIRISASERLEK